MEPQGYKLDKKNYKLIGDYLNQLKKNPRSRIFVPLAELYRKLSLHQDAIEILLEGLKFHPNFISAHVSLGRCYLENGNLAQAVFHLQTACNFSKENLLAQKLLGKTYLKLNQPEKALNCFSIVSQLVPDDQTIKHLIKKLESKSENELPDWQKTIHSDEYQIKSLDQIFKKISSARIDSSGSPLNTETLAKIYIQQGEYYKAAEIYKNILAFDPDNQLAKQKLSEINSQFNQQIKSYNKILTEEKPKSEQKTNQQKIKKLNRLLARLKSLPQHGN